MAGPQIIKMPSSLAFPATSKPNILVVDDRPDGLLALEAVLSGQSYNLIKANSGREALDFMWHHDFAVILLDVQMPELNGFETASLIRENPRAKETPIIFVTAISKDNGHIYQGYEVGAVDYVFKPFDPFILKSKVNVFVDLFNKNQQIKQQARLLREMELREKDRRMAELERESLQRYIHLADSIPHLVLKVQKDGKVEYFNQMCYRYTGNKYALEKDADWHHFLYPTDRRKLFSLWLKNRKQHIHNFQIEGRIKGADGNYRWHLIWVVAEERNGEVTGWIGTCTDIHDRKNREEKFVRLTEELNRSNKELQQFAYVASHDLKEPLYVVNNYAQLLSKRFKGKLNADADEFIHYMSEGLARMQNLIDGLLSYSMIGKKDSALKEISCEVCYKNALSNLQAAIQESSAIVEADPLPIVFGNEMQIVQLFQNLIHNAIKFRGSEPARVYVSVESKDNEWVFAVKDNGIGIKPEYFEQIFEIFRRLNNPAKYKGTGIGLAICRKIVEQHGGRMWVNSEEGKGSTFYFTLSKKKKNHGS